MNAFAVLALVLSVPALADHSAATNRDVALLEIQSCLKNSDEPARQCKNLDANIRTLQEAYRGGDKFLLTTLFKFPYLAEFFGDALVADPEGFLTALSLLPEKDQRAVATGVSGGMFGLRSKDRFERIRAALRGIPEGQPIFSAAQTCLQATERRNADFLVPYFPPGTFTGKAGEFAVRMYASGMYALGEKPWWPTPAADRPSYRLTYLSSFGDAVVVTLMVVGDGSGEIAVRSFNWEKELVTDDRTVTITKGEVVRFLGALDQAHFWQASTELPAPKGRLRTDGTEWIMEGVKEGDYHVAVRWSPDFERQDADEIRFADAGQLLFKLAGRKLGRHK